MNSVQIVDPGVPVTVTAAAARHLVQQIRAAQARAIRLGVKESGCTGYMYVLDLAEAPAPGDLVLELEGGALYVDAAALPVLRGTEIDYVREGLNSTLKFRNPNVAEQCGCGESFSVSGDAH